MLVLESWLLLLTDSPERNQTRMQLDELPKLSLFTVFSYLRIAELPAVLFTTKALAVRVGEYLQEEPIELCKEDTARMSQHRVTDLLDMVPSHRRLELCCFKSRLYKTMGCIHGELQVLKLLLVEEQYVYRQQFWRYLLEHRGSLHRLTLSMSSTTQQEVPQQERISEASMRLFFNEMVVLEQFSYKLSSGSSEESRFDYAGYAANELPCHTLVLVGLLSSSSQIKKLTLRNLILIQAAIAQWPTLNSVEQLKIEYKGNSPELVLPANSLRLRLTNHTFLFVLRCFPALRKLSICDWSNLDDKFLCNESIAQLMQHSSRLQQPLQLMLNSYTWHWQLSKLDLFQLCELPLGGQLLSLRSLYSLDADAINLVANSKAWKVNGFDFSYTNINDECLDAIADVYSHVKTLGLSGCKKPSKQQLMECLSKLTSLENFSGQETQGFTNSGLQALVEASHNTLTTLRLKKNKINGDAIADCLRRCNHLSTLVLRNMNNIYDDFHFRWVAGLHAEKFRSNTLLELDISNNERFERKFLKRLRKLFPCLQTLKMIYTVDIQERQPMVHPSLLYLTALVDVTKARKYKETCLQAFPNLLILHTELKKQTRSGMHLLHPDDYERQLMIYDNDGELFVV